MSVGPRLLLFAALLGLGSSGAHAWRTPWFLAQCPESAGAKAAKVASAVRRARPGDTDYVRYPFPRSAAAVFGDFVQQLEEMWDEEVAATLAPAQRELLLLLEQQLIRYEVVEVAEWRPMRCGPVYGRIDTFFLLRLFRADGGGEIARASLLESGLLASWHVKGPSTSSLALADGHDIEEMARALEVARGFGLDPKQLQYVALASFSIVCQDLAPCLAFRDGGAVFLYRAGQLFELDHERTRFKTSQIVSDSPEREAAIQALRPGEHLVTLGLEEMTIARPVTAAVNR